MASQFTLIAGLAKVIDQGQVLTDAIYELQMWEGEGEPSAITGILSPLSGKMFYKLDNEYTLKMDNGQIYHIIINWQDPDTNRIYIRGEEI